MWQRQRHDADADVVRAGTLGPARSNHPPGARHHAIGRVAQRGEVTLRRRLHRLARHPGRAAVEDALAAKAMCALHAEGDGIAVDVDDRWFRVSAASRRSAPNPGGLTVPGVDPGAVLGAVAAVLGESNHARLACEIALRVAALGSERRTWLPRSSCCVQRARASLSALVVERALGINARSSFARGLRGRFECSAFVRLYVRRRDFPDLPTRGRRQEMCAAIAFGPSGIPSGIPRGRG